MYNFSRKASRASLTRKLAAVAAASTLLGAASTAYSATANGTATASIVEAIGITSNVNLAFGSIVPDSGSVGNVVLGTDDTVNCMMVTCVPQSTTTSGSFSVTGQGNYTYAITLPSSPVIIDNSGSGGTGTMTIDTFTSNPSGTGTLSNGSQTLKVGATLSVDMNQEAGDYTGSYTVEVAYN